LWSGCSARCKPCGCAAERCWSIWRKHWTRIVTACRLPNYSPPSERL
jgi:hypothetical protein